MLEGYEKLPNGVIKQISPESFKYDHAYADHYNSLGEKGRNMGWMRLGFIIGAIGRVPESILDCGIGNGDFLNAAKQLIPKCYGHDVSGYPMPENVEYAPDIFGKVDVITFFDCLEHFIDITVIRNLRAQFVVVSLPCCHYPNDEWFENWKHRKPNEHIFHFNKESLYRFMDEMGYYSIMISNPEDSIRKSVHEGYENIITGVFRKKL